MKLKLTLYDLTFALLFSVVTHYVKMVCTMHFTYLYQYLHSVPKYGRIVLFKKVLIILSSAEIRYLCRNSSNIVVLDITARMQIYDWLRWSQIGNRS